MPEPFPYDVFLSHKDFREESEVAFAEAQATLLGTLPPGLLSGKLSIATDASQ